MKIDFEMYIGETAVRFWYDVDRYCDMGKWLYSADELRHEPDISLTPSQQFEADYKAGSLAESAFCNE